MELNRAYPEYRALGGEILSVSPTPLDRARIYQKRYELAYPCLSDPTGEVFSRYGLGRETAWGVLNRGAKLISSAAAELAKGEFKHLGTMPELSLFQFRRVAFFIIDKKGTLRHAEEKVTEHALPGREQIVEFLRQAV